MNHGTGEILRYQPSDDVGLDDVGADGLEVLGSGIKAGGSGREIRRDHVAAGKATFDDLHEAGVRREYRSNARRINLRNGLDRLSRGFQRREVLLVEDVAGLVDQRYKDSVGATELSLVVHKGLHVLVLQRQLLAEARVDLERAGGRQESEGDQCKDHQHQSAISENDLFQRWIPRVIRARSETCHDLLPG